MTAPFYDHSETVERLVQLHEVPVQGPPAGYNAAVPVQDTVGWQSMYSAMQHAAATWAEMASAIAGAGGALANYNASLEADQDDDV